MKKLTSMLIAFSIGLTLCVGGFTTSAQKAAKDKSKTRPPDEDALAKSLKKNWDKLPERAKRAISDPKAKATWEGLTPRQREKLKAKVREIIRKELAKPAAAQQAQRQAWEKQNAERKSARADAAEATLSFIDPSGNQHLMKATRPSSLRASARTAAAPWDGDWASERSTAEPGKFHHARRGALKNSLTASSPQAGCSRPPEQFVRNFYQMALGRPPNATELSQWLNTLAQAQSQGTTLAASQSLGNTLFLSTEYANRGRTNSQFVSDCYKAFLNRDPDGSGWQWWTGQADQHGQPAVVQAFVVCSEFSDNVNALCNVNSFDGDQDGLPDNFENVVADNFTPYYHVSQYEADNYSTFEDFVPLTVKGRFGQSPVSHFRVVPLRGGNGPIRWNSVAGRWESFLRVDYLTLWDHDSGLAGNSCDLAPGEQLLEGLLGHEFDAERSALLVSAPAVWTGSGFAVNVDPNAYSSLSLYTAAHEGTPTSHSAYLNFPQNPRGPGNRFELWQALMKHSTYTYNPDFETLLGQWQIDFFEQLIYNIFSSIECYNFNDLFWIEMFGDPSMGWSCDTWFWISVAVVYYVTILFYVCAVERFYEQGGSLANIRINVGEPRQASVSGNPINGSEFIQDDSQRALRLYNKLIQSLEFESMF
ncbi:MAG: hypothetical protein QOE77_2527 [Blastocatellia bacterium]|jgi:hypothetical protein|nr:hypothetical protein [Blastocatellia bacterium]